MKHPGAATLPNDPPADLIHREDERDTSTYTVRTQIDHARREVMNMRAAVFREPGTPLSVENVDDPSPAAGQVVIAVKRCGICGTDL